MSKGFTTQTDAGTVDGEALVTLVQLDTEAAAKVGPLGRVLDWCSANERRAFVTIGATATTGLVVAIHIADAIAAYHGGFVHAG